MILVALIIIPPTFAISNELVGSRLYKCLFGKRGKPSRFARLTAFLMGLFVYRLDRIFGVQSVRDLDVRAATRQRRATKRMSDRSAELESEVSDIKLNLSEPVVVSEDVTESNESAQMKPPRHSRSSSRSSLKAVARLKSKGRLNLPPPLPPAGASEPTDVVPIGSLSARFYGTRQQAPAAATAGTAPLNETVAETAAGREGSTSAKLEENLSREPPEAAREPGFQLTLSSFFTPQGTPESSMPRRQPVVEGDSPILEA